MRKISNPIISNRPLEEWHGSLSVFDGLFGTIPKDGITNATWDEISDFLRPHKPLIIEDKTKAIYVLPCLLTEGPLTGSTLEAAKKAGKPVIGKMRSKNHVTQAAMLIFDIDGTTQEEFDALLETLKKNSITYLIYTTYSHGDPDKPGIRVRLITPIDRPVGTEEYSRAWHGFNPRYLNGKADPSSAKLYQQQGIWSCHPSRSEQAEFWVNDADVLSTNELIQLEQQTHQIQQTQYKQSAKDNGKSYTPSDANKVADQCKQIREFRDKNGAGQSEPLWYDCLGITAHCTNGEAISQDWSSGHLGYDKAKTAKKLEYRLKIPPTTCAQFKKSNPLDCNGCTQQCNSPITLGWKNESEAELSASTTESIDLLERIQQQYCLISINGRVWVLDRSTLNICSEHRTAAKLSLSNRSDGTLLLTRTAKALSPQVDAFKIVKEFFISPQTICYNGVEFNPVGTSSEKLLNLWVGPTITPQPGDWRLIATYLLDVICDNDSDAYNFLIRFLAHALQRPEEKPGILIILIGGQGVGKGTLAKILRRIWSATFLQIHNIDSVTGSFNAALERNFIVFMDEALFVGDRRASDALKSLVTEPVIHINEKYQPERQMQSFHRFFAGTNAEHFKNTERDDRRDFVLRVSEARKGDHAYWKALNSEIEKGGVEAMIYDLLALDISNFNVRSKPSTQGLIDQKLQSLEPIPRWWHNSLIDGGFSEDEKWPDFIKTSTIVNDVFEMAGGRVFRKPGPVEVSRAMGKLCPSASQKQLQNSYDRGRGYSLPPLAQAREEFEDYIGGKIDW